MEFEEYLKEAIEDTDIRVVILSGKSTKNEDGLFVTARKFKEACIKNNIECYVAFSEEAFLKKDKNENIRIHNLDDKIGFKIDKNNTVFIVRNSVMRKKSSIDLLSQVEKNDIFCINNRESMEICEDKYRTILKLVDSGISVPMTALVTNEEGIDIAVKKIGGKFPIVVKTLTGSKGLGVFIVDRIESLKSTLQTIWKINPDTEVIFQEYIEAAFDVRIHVLGNKIIAAMKRFKIKKDFRSNYSLGGKVAEVKLTDEQKNIAILSSKSVGAIWSGVDMMIDKNGKAYIIEINTSPGTEGIEIATEKSIIDIVLKYAFNKKHWRLKPTECGYLEAIHIEMLGDLSAKMDTGNGSYCVIDTPKWSVADESVSWFFGGKKYTHKMESVKKVKVGGVKNEFEDRPVILLDVLFNGKTYKDIKFTLSNREGMTTPILMNRHFIRLANLMVNPARRYAITLKPKKELKEESIYNRIFGDII